MGLEEGEEGGPEKVNGRVNLFGRVLGAPRWARVGAPGPLGGVRKGKNGSQKRLTAA